LRLFRNDIIGVDEVEEVPTLNPVEKRNFSLLVDGIPTHMRNFVVRVGVEFHYLSMDKVQPSLVPKFFTLRKENLQTKTDAQIRFPLFDGSEKRIDQAECFQIFHTIFKGAHSRKDEGRGVFNLSLAPGQFGFEANPPETFLNVSKVSHSIINNDDS